MRSTDFHLHRRRRSDDVAFAFFESYLDRVDGAMAVQVWSACLTFVRDFLGNMSTSKPYIFACLRCAQAPLFVRRCR